VIERLGPPLRSGDRFLLPQKQGFEAEFKQAELSKFRNLLALDQRHQLVLLYRV
jgi:hypothetical protein